MCDKVVRSVEKPRGRAWIRGEGRSSGALGRKSGARAPEAAVLQRREPAGRGTL